MKRVVVTGLGMVSPVGLTVEDSWKATLLGQSGIAKITAFDPSRLTAQLAAEVKDFKPELFMDPKEARRASRFIQLAVAAAKEAVEDAQIQDGGERERIGCSIGVGIGAIDEIDRTSHLLNTKGPKRISPFFIPYVITNMAAGVVANTFNLQGPNHCTTTACTSGTHGVGEAFMYIRNDMADVMVCGGAEAAICELAVGSFNNMKALSTNNEAGSAASRPFDRDRDGFVMGEGSGILVLEDYERAKKRGATIYAEVKGYGMSGDAYHITAPPPGHVGAIRCMKAALHSAGVDRSEVDYINAHGTSTKMNDAYESQAVREVFADHADKLWMSSTKGVTGHCLGAAGGLEAVFTAKAIQEGRVPPTANLENPDPECDLDYVAGQAREKSIRFAVSNSFGFGGTNASLVFGKV